MGAESIISGYILNMPSWHWAGIYTISRWVIQQVVLKKIIYTTDQNKAFDRSMIDWYESKS